MTFVTLNDLMFLVNTNCCKSITIILKEDKSDLGKNKAVLFRKKQQNMTKFALKTMLNVTKLIIVIG